jgi:hypothetical protein
MDKLDNQTFKRFKLIEGLINKYPIINFDTSEIDKIKKNYIEYEPKYEIISGKIKLEDGFMDNKIKSDINKFEKYIQIKEENIDIKIVHDTITKKLINTIYNIIKLFIKLYGNRKIIIRIVLSQIPREISSKIIGKGNVNGGQTDFIKIEVYRREEVIKVLCHELIHFYKLDCNVIDKHQDKILDPFNIKTIDTYQSIQEAYTEYLAVMHHIGIISYYIKKSPLIIYHYEKIWSLYQVCKILKHYNMEKFEDLYENKFIQETNVFSYYIIKFFMLWKLDNKCSYKNLINVLDDKEIIKIINENLKLNLNFDKNLRMTLFELNYN